MSTISYSFDPGTTVWVILDEVESRHSVTQGTVVKFRADITSNSSSLKYSVSVSNGAGEQILDPSRVFATQNDAIVAYTAML